MKRIVLSFQIQSKNNFQLFHKPAHISKRFFMSKQPPKFKFAAVQLAVTSDKAKNLTNAESMIRKASENGAQVISLPEVCLKNFFKKKKSLKPLFFLIVLELSLWK